jgi:deoxyribonuclease V
MDVAYADTGQAYAAGLGFDGFDAAAPRWEGGVLVPTTAPYEPGAFYRRELPCLLALIDAARGAGFSPQALLVDGYASFGIPGRTALGEHLARSTGLPVVGVAKTAFAGASHREVLRGGSVQPLYVTTVEMDLERAAEAVRAMHGAHRLPEMLARVDSAARLGLETARARSADIE